MSKYSDNATIKLSNWESLVKALIRPPRQEYKLSQLGSSLLNFKGTVYKHSQTNVNHQAKQIELTLYEPVDFPCKFVVLYLHGNSSSRVEALTLLPGLPSTFGLASFDFLGCGLNKQQFISLGINEADQIRSVVKYLESKQYRVILWGRSMGAASSLKYGGTFITVVDSPFCSMKRVCKQTAVSKKPQYIPSCLISCLFPCIFYKLRADVKKAANFDLNQLNIEKHVSQMDPSKVLIFLVATQDTLINYSHSSRLYEIFRGSQKRIWKVNGTHNSKRSDSTYLQIFQYIQKVIEQEQNVIQLSQKVKDCYEQAPTSSNGIVMLEDQL